jgi:hypothetical protein
MNPSSEAADPPHQRIDLASRLMKQDCGGGASIESPPWQSDAEDTAMRAER